MIRLKDLFSPTINISPSGGPLTIPPMPAAPAKTSPRLRLSEPQPPEVRRVLVLQTCSKRGQQFYSVFRENRISGKFFYVEATFASAGDGGDIKTYDLRDLDFRHATCPVCHNSAMPVHCHSCGAYLCRAARTKDRYFQCPCGYAGFIRPELKTIEGVEGLPKGPMALGSVLLLPRR